MNRAFSSSLSSVWFDVGNQETNKIWNRKKTLGIISFEGWEYTYTVRRIDFHLGYGYVLFFKLIYMLVVLNGGTRKTPMKQIAVYNS